ncbi:MAG: hypothetical protein ACXV7G_11050 [Halobacteriota archaeon]
MRQEIGGINVGSSILSLPTDIPWERLAVSQDMIDTDLLDDFMLPKWLPSLAAFYYIVPEDETKDLYPDRRIVYLKVSASITGCNMTNAGVIGDEFVDQYIKEVVTSIGAGQFDEDLLYQVTGTLSNYYPCFGAILQVGVYPYVSELNTPFYDFPYIQDFEPKKREVYEVTTSTGEVLSGSSNKINVGKGTTNTNTREDSDLLTGVSCSAGAWGTGVSASEQGKWGSETTAQSQNTEQTSVDAAQEKRETTSFSTSINQMYQPLLSYHLGTNRALWSIAPRPHTVDSEFNLINPYGASASTASPEVGAIVCGRKLEGIQDSFIVVNMPKTAKGLSVQITLDCGYDVFDAVVDGQYFLVILRRILKGTGYFDDSGKFQVGFETLFPGTTLGELGPRGAVVIGEARASKPLAVSIADLRDPSKKGDIVAAVNNNMKTSMNVMVKGFTDRTYKPRIFLETEAFKQTVLNAAEASTVSLDKVLSGKDLQAAKQSGLLTVGELIKAQKTTTNLTIKQIAASVANKATTVGQHIIDYEQKKNPQ